MFIGGYNLMKCPNCGIEVKKVEQNGNSTYFEVSMKKTPPHYKIMTRHFCRRKFKK